MSQIKFKCRDILVKLSPAAKRLKCREARKRFYDLEYICFSNLSLKDACLKQGISDDYFRKWAKKIISNPVLESLKSVSRRPKLSPKRIRKNVIQMIKTVREASPFLGPDRVLEKLKDVFPSRKLPSESSVLRILKRLGLVTKQYRLKQTKKHMKRYRKTYPGYLQMDFKYVPYLVNNKQYYQLSAVDHHSDWRLIRIYDNKGFEALDYFLHDLEKEVPFEILEIQTDNDTCFTDKFTALRQDLEPSGEHELDLWCKARNIRHKLIPVGEKELNGKVENTHKQDDREFFSQIRPVKDLDQLQTESKRYETYWNERRKTKARGRLTPNEMIFKASIKAVFYLIHLGVLNQKKGVYQISDYGVLSLRVPKKIKNKTVRKQRRKKDLLDRYINYCEGTAYKKYS